MSSFGGQRRSVTLRGSSTTLACSASSASASAIVPAFLFHISAFLFSKALMFFRNPFGCLRSARSCSGHTLRNKAQRFLDRRLAVEDIGRKDVDHGGESSRSRSRGACSTSAPIPGRFSTMVYVRTSKVEYRPHQGRRERNKCYIDDTIMSSSRTSFVRFRSHSGSKMRAVSLVVQLRLRMYK